MNRLWNNVIKPIIERIDAKYIVEVGSDTGLNTKNILEYCLKHDARMTAIDPFPKFDAGEFKARYGNKFEIYLELSLSRLPLLNDYDVILIDGDHNWYTVYNELKIIEKNFKNKKFPLVFLHDVGWPYARRDLYYNPENIPEIYRQPYKKLGMHPDQTDLKKTGGLNTHLYNSIYENNPQNGVLTAVEDFIEESDLNFSFKIINIFHGLGILFPKNEEIENVTNKIINNTDLLSIVEEERVKQSINYFESEIAHNKTKKTLENLYETQKTMKYELKSSQELIQQKELHINSIKDQLNQTENKLKSSQELIQQKELHINSIKDQLNQTENKLKSSQELIQQKELHINSIKDQLNQTENKLKSSQEIIQAKNLYLESVVDQLNQTENKLKSSQEIIQAKNLYLESVVDHLNQTENKLKSSQELIQQKELHINSMADKLNQTENKLKSSQELIQQKECQFYEMEYLSGKKRPIIQRLISRFHTLYILFNINETGFKNALINIKGYNAIKKNNLLDIGYYLKKYPHVKSSGMDPILHYMYHGFKEGKKPNPNFDGDFYFKKYPDVRNSNMNPLVHYTLFGINEERETIENKQITLKTKSHISKTNSNQLKYYDNKKVTAKKPSNNELKDYQLKKCVSDMVNNTYNKSADFVDYDTDFNVEFNEDDVKLIAFYLPQFHPFPENDKWWEKGFTEWTNVTKAVPLFAGHYQPHLPIDLGFYDLRLIENQKRQVELAKKYGIFGFCFHYYWFNGKTLMEDPLKTFLENPEELDFPFCICWANENWSRRWDGSDDSILISQNYSPENDLEFIKKLSKYLKDSRYIKIDNKPFIMVYKPQLLPNPKKTFLRWREYCRKEGIGELYIIGARRHDFILKPEEYGLDNAVEFPPNNPHPHQLKKNVKYFNKKFKPKVYDLAKFVESKNYLLEQDDFEKFKAVIPYWDNTPRRGNNGQVYVGTPDTYKTWLKDVITLTKEKFGKNQQFVFINAWNEWAEGAHLEPDRKYGYAYLKATADAIIETRNKSKKELESLENKHKVSVIMPTYNRRNVIDKAIDSVLNQTFSNYELIICDDGSTDNTELFVKSKYEKFLNDDKIVYIKQGNFGVSKARNTALENANGDLIAYLDSDNIWKPTYLEKMVSVFNEKDCNTAYCSIKVNDKDAFYGKQQFIRNEEYDRKKLLNANFIDLNVFMHKKVLYYQMGGFNETLSSMVDWDLILRYTRFNEPYHLKETLVEYYLDKNLNNITYTVNHHDDYVKLLKSHSIEKLKGQKDPKSPKKISIKLPTTNWDRVHKWGDYHFALALKKEFEKSNHLVRIHIPSEWDREDDADVVLVLRGLFKYKPKPNNYNIMWCISHPEKVSLEEFNKYDYVFVASEKLADELKSKLDVPVESLLQCSDPELFYPEFSKQYEHELLFVGNTRGKFRKIIKDLLPTEKDLGLYGEGWDEFIDDKYISGEYIPNAALHEAYSSCKILLNDHWEDMREKGFISNRIFDGFASGAFIISDEIVGAKEIFGDSLITYQNRDDLNHLINYYLENDEEREKLAENGRNIVLNYHTFEKRAERILEIIRIHFSMEKNLSKTSSKNGSKLSDTTVAKK